MEREDAKKLLEELLSDDEPEELPVIKGEIVASVDEAERIQTDKAKAIHDSINESTEALLDKTSNWAAKGGSLELSSADGLRHLLAESRDRASMFMAILGLQRMRRISNLVGVTDDLETTLFDKERIANMETMELIQALKHVDTTSKQLIDFVNNSLEDSTTGAQILVNLIDARSLTLSREDVPEARSREVIRNAVMGLLDEFQNPKGLLPNLEEELDEQVESPSGE